MGSSPPPELIPRKRPRQARSTITVDAIFQAAIQVLLADGLTRLNTTRVAQRAGVSVGTLYQYFPNKESLLYGLLERHITLIADSIETTCLEHQGASLATMAEALVEGYLHTKTTQGDLSRAFYIIAEEPDSTFLIEAETQKAEKATAEMLSTAINSKLPDLNPGSQTLLAALFGTVQLLIKFQLEPSVYCNRVAQIKLICRSYLIAAMKTDPACQT